MYMNINVQGAFKMKIKKILFIILLISILSFNSFCFAYEEENPINGLCVAR